MRVKVSAGTLSTSPTYQVTYKDASHLTGEQIWMVCKPAFHLQQIIY